MEIFSKLKGKKLLCVYFLLEYSFVMDQRICRQKCVGDVDVNGARGNLVSEVNVTRKLGEIRINLRKLVARFCIGK